MLGDGRNVAKRKSTGSKNNPKGVLLSWLLFRTVARW